MVPLSQTDPAQNLEEDGTQEVAGGTGTVGLTQALEVTLMEAGTLEDTSTLAIMRGGQSPDLEVILMEMGTQEATSTLATMGGGQRPGQEVTIAEVMAVVDTSMMAITAAGDTSQEVGPTVQDLSSWLSLLD